MQFTSRVLYRLPLSFMQFQPTILDIIHLIPFGIYVKHQSPTAQPVQLLAR